MDIKQLLEQLQAHEEVFRSAGDLARELQGHVASRLKSDTGNLETDLVTDADLAVQRQILKSLVHTDLVGCRLLAEEDSPELAALKADFSPDSRLVLSLDPIDGTKRYCEGEPYYSVIIGLHDGSRPLYTFLYYPAFSWWIRLIEDHADTSGPLPGAENLPDLSRSIVYTAGKPHQDLPERVAELEARGFRFDHGEKVANCGSKFLLMSGQAAGYYSADPNAYDGLLGWHYGLANKRPVESAGRSSDGFGGPFDLSRTVPGRYGMNYPGYYLVMPPGSD